MRRSANLFSLAALAGCLLAGHRGWAAPINYTRLHSFGLTNTSGESPSANVIMAKDGLLYGTTELGGGAGGGTVFRVNTNGTGYTVLLSLGAGTNDGVNPDGPLLEASDGALYGTTFSGGPNFSGTVFKLNKNGSGYTNVYSFQALSPSDGANPHCALIEGSDGALYGTTENGGATNSGTVFKVNKDGTGYALLHSFGVTANDGQNPAAGLILASDAAFYGTTSAGGTAGLGTLFKLTKVGATYTYAVLRSFQGAITDGAAPQSPLIEGATDGLLYGTTSAGGTADAGTIFTIKKTGNSYSVLRSFLGATTGDGQYPTTGLREGNDHVLYGTTEYGGTNNGGTIFKINRSGFGYSIVWNFGVSLGDGTDPRAALVEGTNGVLYATTYYGGAAQAGTVLKINKDGSGYAVLWNFLKSGGDGWYPVSALTEGTDGMVYGTTYFGGGADLGTLFRMNKDGSAYAVIKAYDLNAGSGQFPSAGLTVGGTDGMFYGTTEGGGSNGHGTVFKLKQDGTAYLTLLSFGTITNDGQRPKGGVLPGSDGALYGVTTSGGSAGYGTVFRLNRTGTGYTNLWNFGNVAQDGQNPNSGLLEAREGGLYGTTTGGGAAGFGIVFTLNPDGTGYATLWDFGNTPEDGQNPAAALMEASDGTLYGTTELGGSAGFGTVFKLNRDGTGYTNLWSFGNTASDGRYPVAGLTEGPDSALYGTTRLGGVSGSGTVFRINRDGTSYAVVWSSPSTGGAGQYPYSALTHGNDGALYMTTSAGGDLDFGTISRFVLPPLLLNPVGIGNTFSFQFMSVSNLVYSPQYKGALGEATWTLLPNITGTGGTLTVTNTNQNSFGRFYRVVIP